MRADFRAVDYLSILDLIHVLDGRKIPSPVDPQRKQRAAVILVVIRRLDLGANATRIDDREVPIGADLERVPHGSTERQLGVAQFAAIAPLIIAVRGIEVSVP